MRIAALSVDLDPLEHYHRIHGLRPPGGADPVYGKAAERFGELCGRLGIAGTAFAVGDRLSDPLAASALRRLAREGHEVANHSFSHDYRLARLAREDIAREVRLGAAAVTEATGRAPVGFRAPGYALSGPLVQELASQGYRYDSSAFPAAPYYAAKALALVAMSVARRRSAAVLDRPRALLAPRVPYRPDAGEPYARGGLDLLELPIATGVLGFPLIGTAVAALPGGLLRALSAGTGSLPLFNLELHGTDLLDASDASPELSAQRPDLRVPARAKLERIEAFARFLSRDWVTLAEAARRLGAPS